MKLYELANNYQSALVSLNDMDLPDNVIKDTLEGLSGELEEKAVNVAAFFQNLDAEAKAIKEAEEKMAKRRKAIENRSKWMKDYLKNNMEHCEISEIKCPEFRLKIMKTAGVVVINQSDLIPDEYITTETVTKIDKLAIKKAIKDGKEIPGAHLESGTRIDIK